MSPIRLRYIAGLLVLASLPAALSGQLPQPPDEWWTHLEQDGAYPEAEFDYTMGMTMALKFSVKAVSL